MKSIVRLVNWWKFKEVKTKERCQKNTFNRVKKHIILRIKWKAVDKIKDDLKIREKYFDRKLQSKQTRYLQQLQMVLMMQSYLKKLEIQMMFE